MSCSRCLKHRQNSANGSNSRKCTTCFDWNTEKINIQLPVAYPGNRKKTKCKKITFVSMLDAVKMAMTKRHIWGQTATVEYLKVEGLNVPLITEILSCEEPADILGVIPPVWGTHGEISTHIDTIMHQLFLGVTTTVGMLLKKVFSAFNMFTAFHVSEKHQLKTIRGLQLDWCKCWGFGSIKTPFGPWVSENVLAYARIFKHMYIFLDEINDKTIRVLSQRLVEALVAIIARIMQDTVNEELIVSLDRHVKLFLSHLCKLEMHLNEKKGKPNKKLKVETTSNFSALLNIPSYMRDYGPLRLYWEGGFRGEGLLKYIKPMVKQGSHKITFAGKTMSMYYKDRFLQTIMDLDLNNDEKEDIAKANVRYGNFRTYSNMEQIEASLNDGKALSVIILKDNTICISFKENKLHKTITLVINDDDGKYIDMTYVTTLSLGLKEIIDRKKLQEGLNVSMWGLAIPYKTDTNGAPLYYIITHTWKERCLNPLHNVITFDLPKAYDCKYIY